MASAPDAATLAAAAVPANVRPTAVDDGAEAREMVHRADGQRLLEVLTGIERLRDQLMYTTGEVGNPHAVAEYCSTWLPARRPR